MTSFKKQNLLMSVGIAVITAIVVAFTWVYGKNILAFTIRLTMPVNAIFTLWKLLLVISISIIFGLMTEIRGFKRTLPIISAFTFIWITIGIFSTNVLATGLAVLPVISSSFLTMTIIHFKKLWEIDRVLTEKLVELASTGHLLEGKSADLRIESGLKLIETIFPVSETIIFRYELNGDLHPIGRARKKEQKSSLTERQSSWRKCVELCETAINSKETQIQRNEKSKDAAQIALPLVCDEVVIGALFVDVREDFERQDINLLETLSRQLAINFQRHELRHKQLPYNAWWNSFSTQSLENRLDIINLVHSIIKEESFSAVAGSYLQEAHAIAYLDGSLAYINSRMKSLAGLDVKELSEMDLFKLLEKFKTDVFNEPSLVVRRVMQTGDSFECEIKCADEKTLGLKINLVQIPLNKQAIHVTNVQKIPACFLITFQDISVVKENEKLRSDMVNLMSHELRTPITSIQGFAEILLLESYLPPDTRQYLETIAAESMRASKILSNFLSVANLEQSDKQEIIKTSVELNSLVDEVVEEFSSKAKQKRIQIVERKGDEIPPISADKGLLTKALSNLLDNAIRYSPERTSIIISTILEMDFLRVEVEDKGFGIPKDEQEKIWQKFYRVAHEGQEKQEETTGLGLSLVKEIIEQHKGEVSVLSVEGRGSRFSFRLPRL